MTQRLPRSSEPPALRPRPRRRVMPWHRRVVQALLYGRNVDRDRKARARLGLAAVVGFAVIYCVIAGKLVIFAIAPDSHIARRPASDQRSPTARPEIHDRNDEILATDVKRPSCCSPSRAAPSTGDERGRAADRRDAGPRGQRAAPAAVQQARLRLAQARDHATAAGAGEAARHPGGRLRDREQANLSQRVRGLACPRLRQRRQHRRRRHRELARRPGARRPASRGLRVRPPAGAGGALGGSPGAARAARRADRRQGQVQGEGCSRAHLRGAHRRGDRHGVAARLRPEQPARRGSTRTASTA